MRPQETSDAFVEGLSRYVEQWTDSMTYDTDYVPSKRFMRRMDKMIRSRTSLYHAMTLTGARRAVCVLVALLVLMMSLLSFASVREAIQNFLVTKSVEYNAVSHDRSVSAPETIETVYELGTVLDGYEMVECLQNNNRVDTAYENNEGTFIKLSQSVKTTYDSYIDNTNIEWSEVSYNNIDYLIIYDKQNAIYIIVWEKNGYVFDVTVIADSNYTQEQLLAMCDSLQVKK